MKQLLKSYLIIIAHVIFGLTLLIVFQKVEMPAWLNASALIFIVFLLVNLTSSYIFNLGKELKEYWTLRKLQFLIIGIFAGALIATTPNLISFLTGHSSPENVSFKMEITFSSIAVTLMIVGWEELWFRGLFLNYCNKYLSAINLSLTMGLLFMLIHMLNPDINLIKTGPTLFFAGATLTILYFYYKNIWLPIGLHFGNNYFGSLVETNIDDHLIFGHEGYLNAIILGGLFLVFMIKSKKNTTANNLSVVQQL